jgi:hypothetical protein
MPHIALALHDSGFGKALLVFRQQPEIADEDAGALAGQQQGRCPPDALGAAGDNGRSAG